MKSIPLAAISLLLSFVCLSHATNVSTRLTPKRLIDPNPTGQLQLIIGAGSSPEYLDQWVSTPSSTPIGIPRIRQCVPNQMVYFGFFVTGYAVSANGQMNCTAEVKVLHPDGTAAFDKPFRATTKGPTSRKGFIALNPAMDLTLENTDPEGLYRIVGTLTDHVTGMSTQAIYKIEFGKGQPKPVQQRN